MGLWTRKPETRGKNPTFLLPEPNPNPKIETRPIPETQHLKPENPRVFQVSEFPSKFPIFYSRNSKKFSNFLSKIRLGTFLKNFHTGFIFFFQKYFNLYEVWKILVHKNAIKIAEGSKISYFKTRKTRLKLPKPDPIPRINTRTRLFSSKNAFKFVIF